MSAVEAQWIVISFLNLACRIAIVVVLAAVADSLLRRHGAALKSLVWTMALAAVVLVIAVQVVSAPAPHSPIRFSGVSEANTARVLHHAALPGSEPAPAEVSADQRSGYQPQAGKPDMTSLSPAENVPGLQPGETPPAGDAGSGDVATADLPAGEGNSNHFLPTRGGESRNLFTASRKNSKPTVWQVAGWGVLLLLAISVLLLVRVLIGTLGLKRLILKWRGGTPPATLSRQLEELKKTLRIRRPVRLLVTPGNNAPITFGIFRPTIILPAGLTGGMGPDSLRQMLTHELAHIRRHDSLVVFLQRVCIALCFWHPLVHTAVRRLRVLTEDACDDYVLRVTKSPEEYATCLTHLAAEKSCLIAGISGWIGARRTRLRLERRIERILDPATAGRVGHVTASAAAITVLAAAGVSLGASRLPFFGIAAEENATEPFQRSAEGEAAKPIKNQTPSEQAQRLLDGGKARLAIRVLRRAIEKSPEPSTSTSLRYELARIHQLLVAGEALEETLGDIWATLPRNRDETVRFAEFCIRSGQEKLAKEAISRLQEMAPERKVYYASKLYGAFPKPEELWFPCQPKPLEKTQVKIAKRDAVIYREQLIPALARIALVADLDGDDLPEIILSAPPERTEAWIRVLSQDGDLLWKDEKQQDRGLEDIRAFDLDGDGKLEIIAAGLGITVYDYRGKILWRRPSPQQKERWVFRRACVVRSPDGGCRIIAGSLDYIMCFLPDGNLEWRKSDVFGRSFATLDVNGDGWDEIVTMKIGQKKPMAAVLGQKGREIGTIPGGSEGWNTLLAAADLNGDGKPEIVSRGRRGTLVVSDLDGKVLWKTRSRTRPIYAIRDLDGDGKKEIACVTPRGELRVLNHDGSTRFELAVRTGAVQLADVDGDGKDEIFIATPANRGSYLFCIGHDGELRWRFAFPLTWYFARGFFAMPAAEPGKKGVVAIVSQALILLSGEGNVISITPMGYGNVPKPLAADLDGDGTKEVISTALLARAYDLPGNNALWAAMVPDEQIMDSAAVAIDVDGNGAEELVFACRGYVCVVNGKGELVHTKYVGEFRRPVLGRIDVEGDGKDAILLSDDRRFLVLNEKAELIAAASHRRFEVPGEVSAGEQQGILGADVDSVPGDEVLLCSQFMGVTAYSTKGDVVARFRRPSWLPVHSRYAGMFSWWLPQIFPPMDIDGDGEKELVARIDRLFVWDLQGKLLHIGLNDYPRQGQIAFTRLKNRLNGIIRYVGEGGAFGSFAHYLKNAEKKPLMELYSAAMPIEVGKRTDFLICGEKGFRLKRADGKVLWEIPWRELRGHGAIKRIGFGDFDGDGEREIVMSPTRWWGHAKERISSIEA